MHKKTKAFTLVELIVVIVILSILATIAFLSFGSQSSSARDSTRLSDITQISKWLSVNATTTSVYAIPDKKIGIYSWSTLLGYQWEAWDSVKNVLKATSETFKDPLDKVNYTYSTNAARNKHQVLAFLENSNSISISLTPDTTTNAISYTSRYPYSKWDAMWIILSWSTTSNSYTPIQDISTIQTSTWFDITNTTVNTWMTAFVSNSNQSSSVTTSSLNWFILTTNWIKAKWTSATDAWTSCKELLANWVTASWVYWIKPWSIWTFQAFCDMSTDWWGWTNVWTNFWSIQWITASWSSPTNTWTSANIVNYNYIDLSDNLTCATPFQWYSLNPIIKSSIWVSEIKIEAKNYTISWDVRCWWSLYTVNTSSYTKLNTFDDWYFYTCDNTWKTTPYWNWYWFSAYQSNLLMHYKINYPTTNDYFIAQRAACWVWTIRHQLISVMVR